MSGLCFATIRSSSAPSSILITSRSSATCCAGASLYESTAITYCPNRFTAITNSLPSSPEPRRSIFFMVTNYEFSTKPHFAVHEDNRNFLNERMLLITDDHCKREDQYCILRITNRYHQEIPCILIITSIRSAGKTIQITQATPTFSFTTSAKLRPLILLCSQAMKSKYSKAVCAKGYFES